MPSLKQIRANQQNARRSTGPKTPEGRANTSRNALTHGLSARSLMMPDEDLTAFQQLLDSLYLEHQPVGNHQEYLVRQIAVSQWRLNRLQRIETGLLAFRLQKIREWEARDRARDGEPEELEAGHEYEQATRQLGKVFFDDSTGVDAFTKLSRYEATIRRSFYRALEHLRRAQAEKNTNYRTNPFPPLAPTLSTEPRPRGSGPGPPTLYPLPESRHTQRKATGSRP